MINIILRSPLYNKHIISSIKYLLNKGKIINIFYEIIRFDKLSVNALSEIIELALVHKEQLNIILEPISQNKIRKFLMHFEYINQKIVFSNSVLDEGFEESLKVRGSKLPKKLSNNLFLFTIQHKILKIYFKFNKLVLEKIINYYFWKIVKRNNIKVVKNDLFIFIPFIFPGSLQQILSTKFAKNLSMIGSWDNLTTKGFLYTNPKKMIIWSEFQKDELNNIHSINPYSYICGSLSLQDSFNKYKGYIKDLNKPINKKPLIYYLGSTLSASPTDLKALENIYNLYKNSCQILFRPHPTLKKEFIDKIKSQCKNLEIDTSYNGGETDKYSQNTFFSNIFKSDIIFGTNTTSLLQAALFNKIVVVPSIKPFDLHKTIYHFKYIKFLIENKAIIEITSFKEIEKLINSKINKDELFKFIFNQKIDEGHFINSPAKKLSEYILRESIKN